MTRSLTDLLGASGISVLCCTFSLDYRMWFQHLHVNRPQTSSNSM